MNDKELVLSLQGMNVKQPQVIAFPTSLVTTVTVFLSTISNYC